MDKILTEVLVWLGTNPTHWILAAILAFFIGYFLLIVIKTIFLVEQDHYYADDGWDLY
jgi:hypothetical protein